ncbi:MAG: thiol:disulfide interchange protein, partial [Alistipes sp.]
MSKIFRFLLLPAILMCVFATAQAQQQNVTWKSEVKTLSEGNYRIVLTANIPAKFHMYDMGPYSDMGPNATIITFPSVTGAKLT